ncbi:MAG: NADH-quinone oxidoreductase subunit N [Phycisphaerales bacterium]|jgi:NADH-quinone oxidoreductase subunit N|nr:NADH-quinone oxidoreductase subunit N [Phycisphaerales bacterium]
MSEKIAQLAPEITLFIGTCVVMVVGLARSASSRQACAVVTGFTLLIAGALAVNGPTGSGLFPELLPYAKATIALVGVLLTLVAAGTVDRKDEEEIAAGKRVFDPLRSNRGEFWAFFLFSLTGAMLCASAEDLIWLFLALELTSLPTYVMVAISTSGNRSKESGVKYFFLGALGAAIFLYGFALLYGGTGSTRLPEIAAVVRGQIEAGGISPIVMGGAILALVGVSFKIAAVPMHFYTADVYQGAATPVTAFLAFVPKTAGFLAIMLIVGTLGWNSGPGGVGLPEPVRVLLWVMAGVTMTIGNTLAILQRSAKRVLAYSSIAHSGYMLVGIIAGPGSGTPTENGLAAVLFYLMVYGVTSTGSFAVLACLERRVKHGEAVEIEDISDLRGLCQRDPWLGWTFVICVLSLLGFPPLVGFFAKVPLFTAGIAAGEIPLVIVLGLNSAIAAYYYLRLAGAAMLEDPSDQTSDVVRHPAPMRAAAGPICAAGVLGLSVMGSTLLSAGTDASELARIEPMHRDAGGHDTTPAHEGHDAGDHGSHDSDHGHDAHGAVDSAGAPIADARR